MPTWAVRPAGSGGGVCHVGGSGVVGSDALESPHLATLRRRRGI